MSCELAQPREVQCFDGIMSFVKQYFKSDKYACMFIFKFKCSIRYSVVWADNAYIHRFGWLLWYGTETEWELLKKDLKNEFNWNK